MSSIDPHVSDLFFNYDKDEYLALPEDATDEECHAAILSSATQFASSVEGAFGVKLDPEDLVKDFLGRL